MKIRISKWCVSRHAFPLIAVAVLTSAASTFADDRTPPQSQQGNADIAAKVAAAKGDFNGADCVVVYDATDVVVDKTGLGTNTNTRVVKILTDAGLKSQSTQRWSFDPATNELKLISARIHRADGKAEDVDISTAIEQPETAWIIFWGSRQLVLNIPGLDVGDSLEITHTKSGFNTAYLADAGGLRGGSGGGSRCLQPPMPGHWYDVVTLQEGVPVIEKTYTVRIPKDKPLQYEVKGGEVVSSVTFDGDSLVYRFAKKDIPAFKGEARMVSGSDVMCKLVLATVSDWHAKAIWFHEANESAFETDDAIKQTVKEVISGLETDEEKIVALEHWVAENVRYVGTSRGAHEGYTTHAAIETFHDRGGVCKDKAGLLVAMLREAGFESHIVMTMAGNRVEETPADQFNHAVTCVRTPEGKLRMLDPTWMPKNRETWSSAEQLQTVVYGTPDGKPGKCLTDYSPPEKNFVTFESESVVSPEGAVKGRIQLTTEGCPETNLRRALSGAKPEDRRGRIEESLLGLSPDTQLLSMIVTDPVDFSGPAKLDASYTREGGVPIGKDKFYVKLPALGGVFADLVLPDIRDCASGEAKDRKHPLRLRSTRRFEVKEKVTLPSGMVFKGVPEAVHIDSKAASLEFKAKAEAEGLSYTLRLDIKKHIVPTEQYGDVKKVVDKLLELGKLNLVCRQEEQRAQR